jgi:DNA repair exonuclease SbcCD nuclease subunit
MKLALISDTHFGTRGDNIAFLDNSKRFFEHIFFPYLEENNINTVVHLGDLVDRRKYININTARRLREDFLDPLSKMGLDVHIIAGNHDTYFKNTNDINSLQELVTGKYDFKIYHDNATEVYFDGVPILFLPWICDANRSKILEKIGSTSAQIVMGHLEIQGFEMYKGSTISHGEEKSMFSKFDMVMSGHYHHRSNDGHIFYLGSHDEFTWSDYNDPRGFHIFDTETRELEFIENPYKLFRKVWYNDTKQKDISKINFKNYSGSIIKVIVTAKSDQFLFEKFIENIEAVNPIELQIVEDHFHLDAENDEDIINEAESTLDIFKKYIDNYETKNFDKDKLTKKIIELYNEALSLE